MAEYCPFRFVDSDFYIHETSCWLACTDRKIDTPFQIATGSKVTSFCDFTLECLEISAGENVEIHIGNKLINLPVLSNNLEGNILGIDVISECKIIFENKKVIITSC